MEQAVPAWLAEFGAEVHRLIHKRGAQGRFRDMLEEWHKAAHIIDTTGTIDKAKCADYPLPFRDDRRPSLVEQYAILSAVHDHACRSVERIGPDPYEKLLNSCDREHDLDSWRMAIRYTVLVQELVPELNKDDLSDLRLCLREVAKDLTASEEKAKRQLNTLAVEGAKAPGFLDALELKPNVCGLGINLNHVIKRVVAWFKRRKKR